MGAHSRRIIVCALLLLAGMPSSQARRADPFAQIMALRDEAKRLDRAGQREAAIKCAREAYVLLQKGPGDSHPETQVARYELGLLLAKGEPSQEDAEDAVQIFGQASEDRLQQAKEAAERYLHALQQRTAARRWSGQAQDVVSELQSILPLQKALYGESSIKIAGTLNELAEEYQRKGAYVLAERCLQKSLHIARNRIAERDAAAGPRGKKSVDRDAIRIYHRALIELGAAQHDLEKYAEAEQTLLEAIRYGQEQNTSLWTLAQPYNFLGSVAARRGDRSAARGYFTKALECAQQDPRFGQDPFVLGMRYLDLGNYAKAEEFLLKESKLQKDNARIENSIHAGVNYGLAIATAQQGRTEETRAYLQNLLRESELRLNYGRFALNESRLMPFFDYLRDHDEAYTYTQLLHHINDAAWQRLALTTVLLRKARMLDELANASPLLSLSGSGSSDSEVAERFRQLRRLRGRYAAWVDAARGNSTAAAELDKRAHGLLGQMEGLEADLRQRSAVFAARQPPNPEDVVARVAAALPADAVLIEYLAVRTNRWGADGPEAGELRYLALGLRRDGNIAAWDLGLAGPIDAAAAALVANASLKNWSADEDNKQTQILTERVLRPLQSFLPKRATLIVSPDGILNQVPFAALFLRDKVRLIEEHRLRYVNSGRDLLTQRTTSRALAPPTVFARPDFKAPIRGLSFRSGGRGGWPLASDIWSDLPAAGTEQEKLAEALPGARSFVGAEASEANLLNVRAPVVLHIATHGKYIAPSPASPATTTTSAPEPELDLADLTAGLGPPNPLLRSALILAGAGRARLGSASSSLAGVEPQDGNDGIVTALEASGMDLWGTKLVVLSACESGRGDAVRGQGVLGLRRAFLLAGAESVVATLWPVDDKQTAYFMRQFYAQLAKGVDRVTALQGAMQTMLNTQGIDQPYLWAPFVLIGQEGPIPFASQTPETATRSP